MIKAKQASRLLLAAMGCVFTLSSWAAITSAPTDTVKGRAPTLANVQVNYDDVDQNGMLTVGDILKPTEGSFADLDGDTRTAFTYQWKADGSDIGTGDQYEIQSSDAGKKITLSVVALTDASITDPYESLPVSAVGGSADPSNSGGIDIPANGTVMAVTITGLINGFPQVDSPLTADATCQGGSCSNLNYQWQIETAIGSGVFADIAGATQSTYNPVGGDQKRKIQVVVSN